MKHTLLVVFLNASALNWAQTPTGTIEGAVTDPSLAAVPNAKVTVTELATGRATALKTGDLGNYSARNLLPGLYGLRIEALNFSARRRNLWVVWARFSPVID